MKTTSQSKISSAVPRVPVDAQGAEHWRSGAVGESSGCSGEASFVRESVPAPVFDTRATREGLVWLLCCDMYKGVYENAQMAGTDNVGRLQCVLADGKIVPVPGLKEACQTLNALMIRILHESRMSETEFLQAGIYVSRIWHLKPELVSPATLQSLFVGSCLLSHKMNSDNVLSNSWWAQMLGMRTETLNGIEAEILSALKFGTFINAEEFDAVRAVFEQRIATLQPQLDLSK
ncbi:MAG: hypothetical protein EZS28_000896 [Streblomastix strix]|uniref:Cyclin N-terminal domain-containing protein n=1 Tax=Streblomastix strix TaxID=222440 RepID=A0A5J4X8U2_9EUKA|nr:MAG: hypothetical protein EZS28_000896 [Streblomastix strix]